MDGRPVLAGCGRVLLVVVPVAVQLFVAPPGGDRSPTSDWLSDLLLAARWGLVGEVAAVLLVGAGVGLLTGSRVRPIWVDPDDADDMRRLVDRVRVTRARELLDRADAGRDLG